MGIGMPAPENRHSGGNSRRTVLVAAVANLVIAVAKGVAATLTGSAAMWAETLHSIADTGNELLLLVGLRRSAKAPDAAHPFGYGQERFFWSFLAALGIFLVGGLLSIVEGIRSLLAPEPLESPWLGIGVLVVAFGFEGYSWYTARKQLRQDARDRRRSVREHLARASDPSATTVYLEDSAALVGLGLALVALLLHLFTGWAGWDALASISIGLLLIAVAWLLARRSKALLIDQSAPPDVLQPLRAVLDRQPWIARVERFEAVWVGPARLLLTAQVVPAADGRDVDELLARVGELRRELLRSPAVAEVAVTLLADSPDPDPGPDARRYGTPAGTPPVRSA
jgi:cation diffusion facilitator family transporter